MAALLAAGVKNPVAQIFHLTSGMISARRALTTGVATVSEYDSYSGWRVKAGVTYGGRLPNPPAGDGGLYERETYADVQSVMALLCILIGSLAHKRSSRSREVYAERKQWMNWLTLLQTSVLPIEPSNAAVRAGIREIPSSVLTQMAVVGRVIRLADREMTEDAPPGIRLDSLQSGFVVPNAIAEEPNSLLIELCAIARVLDLPGEGLLAVGAREVGGLFSSAEPTQRSCYLALVYYLCGRPVAMSTATGGAAGGGAAIGPRRTAIETNRPKNLQDKHFEGRDVRSLTGDLKMSPDTQDRVGALWSDDAVFRQAFFVPTLVRVTGPVSATLSPLQTMISLLEFAQLSHVTIIHDFLKAYPWVAFFPPVQGELSLMVEGLQRLKAYPALLQPFAKILERDQLKFFDSKRLSRLARLAKEVMKLTQETLDQYAIGDCDPQLLETFKAWQANGGKAPEGEEELAGGGTMAA